MTTTNTISPVTLSAFQKLTTYGTSSLSEDETAGFIQFLEDLEHDPAPIQQALPAIREGFENGLRIKTERRIELIARLISIFYNGQRSAFDHAYGRVHTAKKGAELKIAADVWSYTGATEDQKMVDIEDYEFLSGKTNPELEVLLSFGERYFQWLGEGVDPAKIYDTEARTKRLNHCFDQLSQGDDWPRRVKNAKNTRLILSCKDAFINIANKIFTYGLERLNQPQVR